MDQRSRNIGFSGLLLLTLIVGVVGGFLLDRLATPPLPVDFWRRPGLDYALIAEARSVIEQNYVDREAVDSRGLTYAAIAGMVDSLGDVGHSRFMTPEIVAEERIAIEGQFEGIGAEIEARDGRIVIVAPIDGSPAEEAGVRPGDVILEVNGEDVSELTVDEVAARVRGPAGTDVTLSLLDPETGLVRDLTLTRARIVIHNVDWASVPGSTVAHLRIAAFSQGVADDVQKALGEIAAQGQTGIILDLRNNPGGLLDEAVGVTSQFLQAGTVLLQKDAQGNITPVPVEEGRPVSDLPLVVLINIGSASASEIVAGALQDSGRAQVMGETSFGTGTVLAQFSLSDGSAILLAISEWLTPEGRVIWKKGIDPDVVVPLTGDVELLTPRAERELTPEQLQASGDQQLLEALERLAAPSRLSP